MKINICGVPEHFNLPWQLGIQSGAFEKKGITLNWKNVPEGTGKMCEMLKNEETDIAIILTEGVLKDISNGNPCVIVQKYVETPLVWGVHIPYNFCFKNIQDLKNEKIAISRLGSGSHLMSMLWTQKNNWDFNQNTYEIVNTLKGAQESLSNNEATVFLWEKFMTKPLVEANVFKKVEDFPTPWPCFVIAIREDFLKKNNLVVSNILEEINFITKSFKDIPEIEKLIATTYNLKEEDVKDWLQITEWSQENFEETEIDAIQSKLMEVNILKEIIEFKKLIKKI